MRVSSNQYHITVNAAAGSIVFNKAGATFTAGTRLTGAAIAPTPPRDLTGSPIGRPLTQTDDLDRFTQRRDLV